MLCSVCIRSSLCQLYVWIFAGRPEDDSDSSFERVKIKHVHQLKNEQGLKNDSYWNDLPEHDGKHGRKTNSDKSSTTRDGTTHPNYHKGDQARNQPPYGHSDADLHENEEPEPKKHVTGVDRHVKTVNVRTSHKPLSGRRVPRSHSPQRPTTSWTYTSPPSTSSPLHPPLNSAVGHVSITCYIRLHVIY